jgi:hypothetical protein
MSIYTQITNFETYVQFRIYKERTNLRGIYVDRSILNETDVAGLCGGEKPLNLTSIVITLLEISRAEGPRKIITG